MPVRVQDSQQHTVCLKTESDRTQAGWLPFCGMHRAVFPEASTIPPDHFYCFLVVPIHSLQDFPF